MADFNGTPGDDVTVGTQNSDNIFGNEGNDVLRGNDGTDWIRGNDGNDFISGDKGVDIIEAGQGNDSVFAGQDDDRTDLIYGDSGNDILAGGKGADAILGATGVDTLLGNVGADLLLQFGIPAGLNEILELAINDAIAPIVVDIPSDITFPEVLSLLDTATNGILTQPLVLENIVTNLTNIIGDVIDDAALGVGQFPQVANPSTFNIAGAGPQGPAIADALSLIEAEGGTIWSGDGEDIAFGDNGADIIGGGADGDFVVGLDGKDTIFGAAGDDLIYGGLGKDVLYGGDQNDWIAGGAGQDTIFDGDGSDTVGGGQNADVLVAGKGDDMMIGTDDNFRGDFDRYVFDRTDGHDTIGMVQLANDQNTADPDDDDFNLFADLDIAPLFVNNSNPNDNNVAIITSPTGPDTIDLSSFGLNSTNSLLFTVADADNDGAIDSTVISEKGNDAWSVTVIGVVDTDPQNWTGIIELEPSFTA